MVMDYFNNLLLVLCIIGLMNLKMVLVIAAGLFLEQLKNN